MAFGRSRAIAMNSWIVRAGKSRFTAITCGNWQNWLTGMKAVR